MSTADEEVATASPQSLAGDEGDDADTAVPTSSTPFTTAAALQLVNRRIRSLEVLRKFHKHLCWMQTVQMTRQDVQASFASEVGRHSFTADCVYLGLGAGRVLDAAPHGVALLNACRQLMREFSYHRSSSPLQIAQLLTARFTPYQFLPEGQPLHVDDSRSVALHKHHGTGSVVYKYLQCPALPFSPDHLETMEATCDVLERLYDALRGLLESARDFGSSERDKVRACACLNACVIVSRRIYQRCAFYSACVCAPSRRLPVSRSKHAFAVSTCVFACVSSLRACACSRARVRDGVAACVRCVRCVRCMRCMRALHALHALHACVRTLRCVRACGAVRCSSARSTRSC
jgi:hypothetical protein